VGKKRKNRERTGVQSPPRAQRPQSWSNKLGDLWPSQSGSAAGSRAQSTDKRSNAGTPPTGSKSQVAAPPSGTSTTSSRVRDTRGALAVQQISRSLAPSETPSGDARDAGVSRDSDAHSASRQRYVERMEKSVPGRRGTSEVRSIPIVLGIDLGTASTKVVWRELDSGRAHALCFGRRSWALEDYLLPSVVAFGGEQLAAGTDMEDFFEKNPMAERFSNFKMCLACISSDASECGPVRCPLSHWRPLLAKSRYSEPLSPEEAVEAVTAFHLAKVISTSRKLVTEILRNRGATAPIRWTVNMAVPVEHLGQRTVLATFQRVLNVGWLMADIFDEEPGPRELNDLLDCYESARVLAAKRVLDCFVQPEVAAEVACMYLSRSARDGIYALVDVGAGTVDASIFRLYSSEDGPKLSFYGGAVLKSGAAYLDAVASRQLAEESLPWFRGLKEGDLLVKGDRLFGLQEAYAFLRNASRWIGERTEAGLRKLLKQAFKKEESSDAWRGLSLVLGGGGANLATYADASKAAFGQLASKLTVERLPVPDDIQLDGLHPELFHRFAVAYGLSFQGVDLGEIDLPHQVEEVPHDAMRPSRVIPEAPTKDVC
jgi:hypothetical protein